MSSNLAAKLWLQTSVVNLNLLQIQNQSMDIEGVITCSY